MKNKIYDGINIPVNKGKVPKKHSKGVKIFLKQLELNGKDLKKKMKKKEKEKKKLLKAARKESAKRQN